MRLPVAPVVLAARGLRGVADGLVSVIVVTHLTALGFGSREVGAVVTGTLFGSAALTLAVGLTMHRLALRRVLVGVAVLMAATGVGFAGFETFWPILAVAVLGTLNPSGGDVTPFLPVEQAVLAGATSERTRTTVYAWYNLGGAFAAALGALSVGAPLRVAQWLGLGPAGAGTVAFLGYAGVGVAVGLLYLAAELPPPPPPAPTRTAMRSRGVVLRLTALFSLDAFGGGFVVQSLLVLWLSLRFGLSVQSIGLVLFGAGLLGAVSQLGSAWLARRIGLVRTMVYTHLPANLFLIAAGIVPHAGAAIACLLARALLSQMDVPARQAYVMALVPPEERGAAASVTNVPRSLAAAVPPLFVGLMLERTTFGWPLVCGGLLKAVYDVLLLAQFRNVHPSGD